MAITPKNDTYSYVGTDGSADEARMVSWFPAASLATEGPDGYPRLRVDNGNTAFFAGREFRFFYEFSTEAGNAIAQGNSRWIKVVLPVDTILRLERLDLDAGTIRYRSWRNAEPQESGSPAFVAPSSPTSGLLSRNGWAQADSGYTLQSRVFIGANGAVTVDGSNNVAGATVSGIARVRVANASGQALTVGGEAQQERGVPAGTYHIQLQALVGAASGTYAFAFEERV